MSKELVEELCSLVLWSARRLKDVQAVFALNDFLKVVNEHTSYEHLEILEKYVKEALDMLNEFKRL